VEERGHKLYVHDFFIARLIQRSHKNKMNCCGTVRPHRKGMPQHLLPQNNSLNKVIFCLILEMTAMVWRDKRDLHILTNMHHPPTNGNFCDKHGNSLQPEIVQHYDKHTGYTDLEDRMTNSHLLQRWTSKWTKKLFFHSLDTTILNSFLLLNACGTEMTHKNFQLSHVRNLTERAGSQPCPY
jgi:hypothetical protein